MRRIVAPNTEVFTFTPVEVNNELDDYVEIRKKQKEHNELHKKNLLG